MNNRIKPLDTEPEIFIIEATPEPSLCSPVAPESHGTSPIPAEPAHEVTVNKIVDTTDKHTNEKADADNADTVSDIVNVAISEELNKTDDNGNTLTDIFNLATGEEAIGDSPTTTQEHVEGGANNLDAEGPDGLTNRNSETNNPDVPLDHKALDNDTMFTGVEEKSGPHGTVVDTLLRSGTDLDETAFVDIFDTAVGLNEEEKITRMKSNGDLRDEEPTRLKISKRVTIDTIPVIIENKVPTDQSNGKNANVQDADFPVNCQVCTAEQLNKESKMIVNMLIKRSSEKLEEHFVESESEVTGEAEGILLKDDNEYVTALNYKEAAETIVKRMIHRSVARLQKEVLTHSDQAEIKRRPVDT